MKYLITLLSICFLVIPSFGQSDYNRMDSLALSLQQHAENESYRQAIADMKTLLGLLQKNDETAAYVSNLAFLARLYEMNGELDTAIKTYKASAQQIETLYGRKLEELGQVYGALALCCIANQQYKEAKEAYKSANEIYSSISIKDVDNYLGLLYSVRSDLLMRNQYLEEELHIAAREAALAKVYYGPRSAQYAEVLAGIGNPFIIMGFYETGYPYLVAALEVYENVSEEYIGEYIELLDDVAMYHFTVANYPEAEKMMQEVLLLTNEYYGEQSPRAASAYNQLAKIDIGTGNYARAEEYLHTAITLLQQGANTYTKDYTAFLHNLGMLYAKLGNDEQAMTMFIKALQSAEDQGLTDNLEYAKLLASVAHEQATFGFLPQAKNTAQKSLQLHKDLLGPDNALLPEIYTLLAGIYYREPNMDSVIMNLQQADIILAQIYDNDELGYQQVLNHKMHIHYLRNRLDSAAIVARQNYELVKKTAGTKHPDYYESLYLLAEAYVRTDNAQAEEWLNKAVAADKEQLVDKLTFLSAEELLAYISDEMYRTNTLLAYAASKQKSGLLTGTLFNNLLLLKGASLKNSNDVLQSIKKSGNGQLLNSYTQWTTLRRKLARQYTLPKNAQTENVDSLEIQAQQLEKALVKESAAFRNLDALLQTDWKQVQSKLKPGEAAVQFVSYDTWQVDKNDEARYAALILRPQDKQPVFVPLFNEEQLKTILGSAVPKEMFSTRSSELLNEVQINPAAYGDSLYRLVWQPLEKHIKGNKTIYLSADGLLHQVAFNALPANDSTLLIDKYRLVQLLSLKDIGNNVARQPVQNIVLFGGIQYDAIQNNPVQDSAYTLLPQDRGMNSSFNYLQGTLDETKSIQALFAGNTATLYSDTAATEEAFKHLSGNAPQVLHLATHGFFIEETKETTTKTGFGENQNAFTLANNPLMRGGLLLAGGNRAWKGLPTPKGTEDGVLTAYEVAGLDLSNTQLVVLSACQTGLGLIQGTEGVFGLQRAFKMAGANTLLMSLWSVPDKETKELMELFYAHYQKSNNARTAFETAQKTMRAKYAPYYWAAFIMVE